MSQLSTSSEPLRALIAAGGTGGHVYPALAVARLLSEKGWLVDWVGTEFGLESRLVRDAGFPLHQVSVSGIRGKSYLVRLKGISRLFLAFWQSLRLMWLLKPDVVLGMGGYVAGPAGVAAWVTRRPLVIHEQNAVAGTTNRCLRPLARNILCGFPGEFSLNQSAREVGNPLRKKMLCQAKSKSDVELAFSASTPFRVLVLGGSLGAEPLNQLLPSMVSYFMEMRQDHNLSLWQQCGEQNRHRTDQAWQASSFKSCRVESYIENMAEAYDWAHIVIARAGALTVSELAATGTPAILIPLPHAIDDHQTCNAQILVQSGGALLLPQHQASPKLLAQHLHDLMDSPEKLLEMGRAARSVARLDATEQVVAVLKDAAHASC